MKATKKILSVLLAVIMLLSTVSYLGTVAFAESSDFVIEDGVLVGYNGKGGDVVIPDGVTGINDCAFSEREDVTSVKISDSVKSIDAGAFEDCTNLVSVTLPNGLKTIESETFMNCINLKNVTIPGSVESIGASAFENCTGLKNVIIPNSVKSIGSCAFNYCKGIESITISDNVTDIEAHAFGYCENLEDIYVFCVSNVYAVKKLMQSFGDYKYTQLDHEFTDNKCRVCGIMEFDIIDGVLYGYYGKGGDVVIPDGVTGIKGAFSNCSSVTSVTIPNSVTSIGAKSFENCVSLTSVVIPCSVKTIGDCAFESCVSLSNITISGNIDMGDSVFGDCGSLVNVYCNCDSDIESVKAFMEDYGRNMFTYTQLDHKFTDNKCQSCGVKEFDIIDGVLYGYYGNGGDVVIPDGVTGIKGAFSNCSSVTSVTIPNSVTSIGAKSFENCVSLTSVVIPCSVKTIGDYAFESCVSLSSITISGNIDIGDSIFDDCGSLVNVYCNCDSDIESVKAFMEDYGRYMFTYTQLEHTFVNNICSACGAKCTDFVIENGVLVGYNGKGGDIVIPDEATEIDNDVFLFNQTITSVKMPNVTKIGKNAFANCYRLTSADMPQVESLGSGVFNGCFELVSADFPNVTSIGGSAFKESSLQSIDISKAANIDNGAFFDCDELTYVTMNSNVELGSFVFDSCTKLKTIYCTCDSDINALINKMDQYGDFTYTQLDHNFVDGVCTFCGAFNELKQAKADALAKIEKFIKDNVPSAAQELSQFKTTVNDIRDNIDNAAEKDEVDSLYANAIKALDEFVPEIYTVTASGATVSKELDLNKSAKYEIATVSIAEKDGIKDGKWFVYWKDRDGNVVSTYSTYKFYVVRDVDLTPVYVSPDEYEAEREKGILVTDIVRSDDNGDGTATLFAEHSASKAAVGDGISQHGIVYTTNAAQKDNLTVDNMNVKKSAAKNTQNALTGLFRAKIDVEENDTVYAKSYMIDAEGNVIYSDLKTLSISAFSASVDSEIITCSSFDSSLVQADEIIPTADEVSAQEETVPSFVTFITNIINAVITLIQSIIALF